MQLFVCYVYNTQGKGKVDPRASTEHHAMKAYWESGVIVPRIL